MMTRQVMEWKKIFAKCVSQRVCIETLLKGRMHSYIPRTAKLYNPVKLDKRLQQALHNRVTSQQIHERYSTPLVIRGNN